MFALMKYERSLEILCLQFKFNSQPLVLKVALFEFGTDAPRTPGLGADGPTMSVVNLSNKSKSTNSLLLNKPIFVPMFVVVEVSQVKFWFIIHGALVYPIGRDPPGWKIHPNLPVLIGIKAKSV